MPQPDEAVLVTPTQLNELQVDILLALVRDESPRAVAERLCLRAEALSQGRLASIMLAGEDGHLHFFAAPSAPAGLKAELDDLTPGPRAGSCGNVAYRHEPTFVKQARTDERWADVREVAEQWQIGSCWSYPIWGRNKLLGTFALTGPNERMPAAGEQHLLETLAAVAAVIVVYAQNARVRARERAQVRFLTKFAQRTANGIIQLDQDNRIVWANPAFEAMSGYDLAELRGQSPRLLHGQESSTVTVQVIQRALTAKESFSLDLKLYHRSGNPFWARIDASPLQGQEGRADGFFAIYTDITERRDELSRLERAKRFYNMLAETNQKISEARDEQELFTAATEIAVHLGGMQVAWIGKPDETGRFAFLASTSANKRAVEHLSTLHISTDPDLPEGQGIAGHAYREQHPFFSQDLATDQRIALWHDDARAFGLNAMAALPILSRGQVVAVFCVYHREHDIFDDELISLLKELASDITRGLDRLALTHEAEQAKAHLERQQALLQSLLAQIDTLITAEDEQDLLEVACKRLIESGLFLSAWIGQPDAQGRIAYLAAGGDAMDTLQQTPLPQAADDALHRAMREQTIATDTQADSPLVAPWMDFALPGWHPAAVALPLQRNDAPWAVLVAVAQNLDDIDRSMTDILGRLSELLSQGLSQLDLRNRLAREQAQSAYLAHHDALTGLANRRALEQTLPLAMARARRDGRQLAVTLIDLDDFKPVNDRFGHAAGDVLLKELALRFREAVRETDLVARLGGDEFVLLLEGLDGDADLSHVLARINGTVDSPFDLNNGQNARIGLSIGITLYPVDESEPDQLIRHADAALYVCKSSKAERKRNWCIWQESTVEELAQPSPARLEDAPYGQTAHALLMQIAPHVDQVAAGFIDRFYEELVHDPESMRIMSYLNKAEFAHLKQRQTDHLKWLLSPGLTEEEHHAEGHKIGKIHALLGIPNSSLVRSITLYFQQFGLILDRHALSVRDQAAIERIVTGRLGGELGIELEAEQQLNTQYQQTMIELDQLWRRTIQWTDFNQVLLDTLVRLPGIVGASISSPGDDGTFVVSQSRGLDNYLQVMQRHYGSVRMPRIDTQHLEAEGPTARAYRFGQIQTLASFATDESALPWRTAAAEAGIRSAASIPITDHRDQPIAVMSIYGTFPGMFESQVRLTFCDQLSALIAQAWRHMATPNQIQVSTQELDRWRHAFYAGGLVMHYQPIIDTNTGRTVKLEALARLELEDGSLVMPGQFLPWLSEHELVRLFTAGLDQALDQLNLWARPGDEPPLRLAINLPPKVLANADCSNWVSEALVRHDIAADRLTLEILEDQEIQDQEGALNQLRVLDELGVELAMDDLGSGYSSLLRLRTLPFHIVKIDQGLVRSAHHDPARVITFIGSLIQLANSLSLSVIVEGLETPDLIEAAAILGADMSQGYGIARPMVADAVRDWTHDNVFQVDTARPRTALGALAVHWRWEYAADTTQSSSAHGEDVRRSIDRFIEQHGLNGSELDLTHRKMHEIKLREGRESPAYRALADAVTELLSARVDRHE